MSSSSYLLFYMRRDTDGEQRRESLSAALQLAETLQHERALEEQADTSHRPRTRRSGRRY